MAFDTLQVKAMEGLLSFTNTISHLILESSYFVRQSFTPQFLAENLLRQSLNLLIGHMLNITSNVAVTVRPHAPLGQTPITIQNLLGQLWCLTF